MFDNAEQRRVIAGDSQMDNADNSFFGHNDISIFVMTFYWFLMLIGPHSSVKSQAIIIRTLEQHKYFINPYDDVIDERPPKY